MTAENSGITQRNQGDAVELRARLDLIELQLQALLEVVNTIEEFTRGLRSVFSEWAYGGARGMRQAAKNFATRPDPDGSRAQFLADGLAGLEAHDGH